MITHYQSGGRLSSSFISCIDKHLIFKKGKREREKKGGHVRVVGSCNLKEDLNQKESGRVKRKIAPGMSRCFCVCSLEEAWNRKENRSCEKK